MTACRGPAHTRSQISEGTDPEAVGGGAGWHRTSDQVCKVNVGNLLAAVLRGSEEGRRGS